MPFLGNIGPGELILVLVIALVIFGPGKLPEIGQAVGKGIREFRRAASDVTDAANGTAAPTTTTPAAGQPTPTPPPVAPVAPPAATAAPPVAPADPPIATATPGSAATSAPTEPQQGDSGQASA